jgi:hypothetical protein
MKGALYAGWEGAGGGGGGRSGYAQRATVARQL